MTLTKLTTVEQTILDAATSLGIGAGRPFRPRMARIITDRIPSKPLLSVFIREIRGSNLLRP